MHKRGMDDESTQRKQGARLKQAREAAGFKTKREAVNHHRWVYPTYAGHENGNRGYSDDAITYAIAYGVRADWLLSGRGSMKGEGTADILSSVPEDKRLHLLDYIKFLNSK